jgi:EAL domain-containing protein (putative c-di-GMP-specific phosphodiesterase class I)
MQGFYFSKPVSSDEAFQLLQNWPEKKKQLFI